MKLRYIDRSQLVAGSIAMLLVFGCAFTVAHLTRSTNGPAEVRFVPLSGDSSHVAIPASLTAVPAIADLPSGLVTGATRVGRAPPTTPSSPAPATEAAPSSRVAPVTEPPASSPQPATTPSPPSATKHPPSGGSSAPSGGSSPKGASGGNSPKGPSGNGGGSFDSSG